MSEQPLHPDVRPETLADAPRTGLPAPSPTAPQIDLPGATLSDAALSPTGPAPPAAPPRARLGRYELFEELGRGGMGAVLRGRDPDLDRDLAVKVVLPGRADVPEVRRRFVEEARIGGRLQHPGVVPVHELGRDADGSPFFAMKLVQGRTLADLLQDRPDPAHDLARFLQIFEQVCQTVAYAHSRGVIHRDLKPQNVMVGAFGEVQLMDWGLAKRLSEPGGTASEVPPPFPPSTEVSSPADVAEGRSATQFVTQAGTILGTPAYMAPEQARGLADQVDERADVFALGAILCQILTGAPPYAGAGSFAVLEKACVGDLDNALTRLNGCGADPELTTLAKACLDLQPAQRPANGAAVADQVAAYRAGVQERLRRAELERATAQARAEEARKRQRLTVAVTLGGLLLLGLAGGGVLWLRQQRLSQEAELTRDVDGDLAVALAAHDEHLPEGLAALERAEGRLGGAGPKALRERLRQVRDELDRRRKDRDMLARLDEARQEGAVLGDDGLDYLSAARRYEETFAGYDLPCADLGPEETARRVRASALREPLVTALDEWARYRWSADKQDALAQRLRQAAALADDNELRRRLRETMWSKDWDEVRRIGDEPAALELPPAGLGLLAAALRWAGRPERGRAVLREAVRRHPSDLWLNFALGRACLVADPPEYDEAVRYCTAALALRPHNDAARNNLAVTLNGQGKPAEAVPHLSVVLRNHPGSARRHNILGWVLQAAATRDPEHPDEAALARAVTELREAVRLEPTNADFHLNLGDGLKAQGQLDAALAEFDTAVRLRPDFGLAHQSRGIVLRQQGKFREALAAAREAVRYLPDSDAPALGLALAHFQLAGALTKENKPDEALEAYREAVRVQPFSASFRRQLGLVLKKQGNLDEAIVHLREAVCLDRTDASLDSKDISLHTSLGFALQAHGEWEEAVVEHREALYLRPDRPLRHFNLAVALTALNRWEEATEENREALRLDDLAPAVPLGPSRADAHYNLGVCFQQMGRLTEAAEQYRQTRRLRANAPKATANLGWTLSALGDLAGAADAFRDAARLQPNDPVSHLNVGLVAAWREDYPAAEDAYRQALKLQPDHAEAQIKLAFALQGQGKFAEAAPLMRDGHEAAARKPGWRYPSEAWARQAGRLADLDGKLPRFLSGEARPADAGEQADLARLCVCKRLPAAAARFYAEAFAARPELADDLAMERRFDAACAAARAGCGRQDGASLGEAERIRLRGQALEWLKAELTARSRQAVLGSPEERGAAREALENWRRVPFLVGGAQPGPLERLPNEERAQWRKLWPEADLAVQRIARIQASGP